MTRALYILAVSCVAIATTAGGQVLRLSERDSGTLLVRAEPGDTVHVAITADLGRYDAAGLTLYVRVPAHGFQVVAASPSAGPFEPGDLFAGAVVVRNDLMAGALAPDMGDSWRLLEYAAVLGASASRARSGAGVVACFGVVCLASASGSIQLHTSPVHESRLVLADGRTEQPFLTTPPLQITVDTQTSVSTRGWADVKRRVP